MNTRDAENDVANDAARRVANPAHSGDGLHGLYVITDERAAGQTSLASHERIARATLAGGARVLQLRGKSTPLKQLIAIGHVLRALTREAGVLFLINDRPDVALAVEADGVHLGPDDFPLAPARKVLGPQRIIGVSCGDETEARRAWENGADYIGAGAVFSTTTKLDAGAPIGLDGLGAIVRATPLPVAAIGGIHLQNIGLVAHSGATMACVISAITQQENEAAMTTATRALIEEFGANTKI